MPTGIFAIIYAFPTAPDFFIASYLKRWDTQTPHSNAMLALL